MGYHTFTCRSDFAIPFPSEFTFSVHSSDSEKNKGRYSQMLDLVIKRV
jgi:hypothetical protein